MFKYAIGSFILLNIIMTGCSGPSIRVGDSIKEGVTLGYFTEQVILDGKTYRLVKLVIKGASDKIALVRKKDGRILNIWEIYELEKAIAAWNALEE